MSQSDLYFPSHTPARESSLSNKVVRVGNSPIPNSVAFKVEKMLIDYKGDRFGVDKTGWATDYRQYSERYKIALDHTKKRLEHYIRLCDFVDAIRPKLEGYQIDGPIRADRYVTPENYKPNPKERQLFQRAHLSLLAKIPLKKFPSEEETAEQLHLADAPIQIKQRSIKAGVEIVSLNDWLNLVDIVESVLNTMEGLIDLHKRGFAVVQLRGVHEKGVSSTEAGALVAQEYLKSAQLIEKAFVQHDPTALAKWQGMEKKRRIHQKTDRTPSYKLLSESEEVLWDYVKGIQDGARQVIQALHSKDNEIESP